MFKRPARTHASILPIETEAANSMLDNSCSLLADGDDCFCDIIRVLYVKFTVLSKNRNVI